MIFCQVYILCLCLSLWFSRLKWLRTFTWHSFHIFLDMLRLWYIQTPKVECGCGKIDLCTFENSWDICRVQFLQIYLQYCLVLSHEGYLISFVLIYILSNLSFFLWNIQYRVAFDKHVIKYVTTGSVLLCTKALSNCTVADYTVCTKPQKTKCSWLNCTVLCICWNKLYTVLHIKFTFY